MASDITFGGMASGLPPNIVEQLMRAERIPLRKMEGKKAKTQQRLDLVNDLNKKLQKMKESIGGLADARGFSDVKLESGNKNIIQGTADPGEIQNGNWNVEVVRLARKAAAITNGFPDKDKTEIGVGYFKFHTKNGTKEVYIDGENNTLQGAARKINQANLGIRATVINDRQNPDRPYKIMLSGDGVGGENQIQYPTLYFLDGDQDLYFSEERKAQNGIIKVDGFEFQINDNKVEDIIPGVTLDLKQASKGNPVNISVKEDREVVSGKVKDWVDATNEVLSFIQQQNNIDGNTDTTRTLGGDSLLRSVENRLRRLIQNPQYGVDSPIKRLNKLGIQFNRSGTLDFEKEKFDSVLTQNPEAVQEFFAGNGFDTGFIASMRRDLGTLTNNSFGPVSIRQDALRNKIDRIDRRIADKERMLVRKEERLKRKFANLEQTVSKLKSQGSALSGLGGGGGATAGLSAAALQSGG